MKQKQFRYFFLLFYCPFQVLFGQDGSNKPATPETKFLNTGLSHECSDKLATLETNSLYKNLYQLIGKNILLGHQDDPCYGVGWKYIAGRSDIRDVTGQYPALYGFDLGRIELGLAYNLDSVPFEKTRLFIREAYERGGVITLSWHLNNPLTGKTAWDNKPGAVASILPGGEKNALYTIWLDRVADFLGSLKGKNGESIPIILRLFHELNGGWFWWGKDQCSPDEMKQLWRYTIHYLRNEKNIHNLLYAFNTDKFNSGAEYVERYPGDDLIDILGFDIYQAGALRENAAFTGFFNKDLDMIDSIALSHHKIPALTEFGYNGVPDSTWWTKVFFPTITSHKIVYALAWRNAGIKRGGNSEYYVPYPGSASASDFKKMSVSGIILFESGIKSKNIYK
ncbi:MAG TPA: glycosyl hydrolase [Puia sp.]